MLNWFSGKQSNNQEAIELREKHYEQFLGPMNNDMYHSTDNKSPHIDIYQFEPHGDRDYWTLILVECPTQSNSFLMECRLRLPHEPKY